MSIKSLFDPQNPTRLIQSNVQIEKDLQFILVIILNKKTQKFIVGFV